VSVNADSRHRWVDGIVQLLVATSGCSQKATVGRREAAGVVACAADEKLLEDAESLASEASLPLWAGRYRW